MVGFEKFSKIFTFTEVKEGLGDNSILLLDVRNEAERQEPGRIPGSVNVPRKTKSGGKENHTVLGRELAVKKCPILRPK